MDFTPLTTTHPEHSYKIICWLLAESEGGGGVAEYLLPNLEKFLILGSSWENGYEVTDTQPVW